MGLGIKPHDSVWHPVGAAFQAVLSAILLVYLARALVKFFRPKKERSG
jgi:hypothetical protein